MASGPVLLGVQVLYGFNFSVTITNSTISYGSKVPIVKPSPSPLPSPQPSWSSSTSSSWQSVFKTNNNITYDAATGAATLAGFVSCPSCGLAPSAGIISLDAYDGDVTLNVTVTAYQ